MANQRDIEAARILGVAGLELPEGHLRALKVLVHLVPPAEIPWAITGSAGLRLQGVDVPVHDLDIQTDPVSILHIEQKLAAYLHTPVHAWESPGMRSLDGKGEIEGVEIELLANIAHLLPDGTWSTITDFSGLIWLDVLGLRVAVFPLEAELAAYTAMGRQEKAALIRARLASR